MTDLAYLRLAAGIAAHWSHDPRTQNAAVLVASGQTVHAANRVPFGVAVTPGRMQPPEKYRYIEHAERAVLMRAARAGIATEGGTLYVPWFACPDCARAIIAAGIREVVGSVVARSRTPARWTEAVVAGEALLREANVGMRWLSGSLGVTITFDGELLEL